MGRKRKTPCKVDKTLQEFVAKGGYGTVYLNKDKLVKVSNTSLKNEYLVMKALNDLEFIPTVFCLENENVLTI